ncbi:hypothetical protein FD724_06765 [Nostoc sp. C057]|uniref:hypothetical protein n=1 Tax=Nostoc sp. C057 TaxID=2576903 RepID=UPI0015C37465|nr:hypothetical protein [Nostoc sp. C057]QLE47841.1 hypothetical protein FD724_06765 [Nostoc sp. C057]
MAQATLDTLLITHFQLKPHLIEQTVPRYFNIEIDSTDDVFCKCCTEFKVVKRALTYLVTFHHALDGLWVSAAVQHDSNAITFHLTLLPIAFILAA